MLRALVIVLVALAGVRAQGRVIVIGVDGLDHGLVSEFIAQGHLPALEALAAEGTFAPLRPTNPAQSPTSWASLTTGLNPGRTGIFGFLRRTVKDGRVRGENALAEVVEIPLMAGGMRWIAWRDRRTRRHRGP